MIPAVPPPLAAAFNQLAPPFEVRANANGVAPALGVNVKLLLVPVAQYNASVLGTTGSELIVNVTLVTLVCEPFRFDASTSNEYDPATTDAVPFTTQCPFATESVTPVGNVVEFAGAHASAAPPVLVIAVANEVPAF